MSGYSIITPDMVLSLTVSSPHAPVVIADADEVVDSLAVVRVDHIRGHVQVLKYIIIIIIKCFLVVNTFVSFGTLTISDHIHCHPP